MIPTTIQTFITIGLLVALATDVINLGVHAEDQDEQIECIPVTADTMGLRPRQEEVNQMVVQAYYSRMAKDVLKSVITELLAIHFFFRFIPSLGSPQQFNILQSLSRGFGPDVMKEVVEEMKKQNLEQTLEADNIETESRTKRSGDITARQKRSYKVECPAQADQSVPYNLRSDPNGYPIELISAELFARSLPGSDLLFQCLVREVIQEEQGPVLERQPLLDNGTICPQFLSQLWTYNSVNFGNILCWALANFQEDILYNDNCMGRPCLGCGRNFPSFHFDKEIRKSCLPLYRTVSLWSFCPSLPENTRIVRDRIIIPSDCSCATIECKRTRFQHVPDPWSHPFFQRH